jgi:fused signal recognition particle receptor
MAILRSIRSSLRAGLSRTREALAGGLGALLRGRPLDEETIARIRELLLKADVGPAATERLAGGLAEAARGGRLSRGEDAIEFLRRELIAMWPAEDRGLARAASGPTVILVVGVNGSGKTTTAAKLAHRVRAQGRSVLLAACDTFRAGAVRQLEVWGERLGIDVVKGQQGGDPAAVAFDAATAATARGIDTLIVDTAGRLQTQDPLMRQLGKVRDVLGRRIAGAPHEVLLVLDATTGQNALSQVSEFGAVAGVTGLVVTKLDGTAKGGVVIAARQAAAAPVKLIGVGERPEDLEDFDPGSFVDAILTG